jgi:protein TonB
MKNRNTNRDQLENRRTTFFLIGLISSLALVLVLFNLKSYFDPLVAGGCPKHEDKWVVEVDILRTFFSAPKAPEKKRTNPASKKPADPIFIALGNDEPFFDEPWEGEVLDSIGHIGEDFVPAIDVLALSRKPIFPGCEQIADEEERFTCFKESMAAYVGQRLKPCSGAFGVIPEKMYAQFIVDENGRITNLEIFRGQDPCNIERVEEVLKNLPAMQPGEHMGRKVRSRFVLPVNIR